MRKRGKGYLFCFEVYLLLVAAIGDPVDLIIAERLHERCQLGVAKVTDVEIRKTL